MVDRFALRHCICETRVADSEGHAMDVFGLTVRLLKRRVCRSMRAHCPDGLQGIATGWY